jgi:hypothetical protein
MRETYHACFKEEKSGREMCILTDREPQTMPLAVLKQIAASMYRTAAHLLHLTRTGAGWPSKG